MKFPAYKSNPIKIQSFLPKVDIMSSKERPKKIGIVGTDGKTYNFLLKCDK
jgi:phosphatidylinositol kinase/protein kinase (PI-3  family)